MGANILEKNYNIVMHLNELLLKGGVLIYPLLLMSVIALYIIFDRIITFLFLGKMNRQWYSNLIEALKAGKVDYVTEEVKNHNNIVANTFSKIFESLENGLSVDYVDNLAGQYAEFEISKLQKKMSLLAIISSAATMVGFLGTVLGLISSFNAISQTTDAVTPSLIANGIYEAMITTAIGLVIGIVSDCFYRYLIGSLDRKIVKLESCTNELLAVIREYRIDFRRK